PRRPRWFRILFVTALVLGLLVLALVLVAAFFNKQITQRVLDEVRNGLRTELVVGDAGLSLLSGFPNASVNLADVRLKDAFGKNLLTAREVAFRFKITSLFSDRIEIKNLRISGGGIAVSVNERGRANYDIFKKKDSANSDLNIALENAELGNLLVSYRNAKTRQAAEVNLHSAGFAGDFVADRFDLSAQADLTVARLQVDQNRYLLGKIVRYNAVIAVDMAKGLFDFQNVELNVGGNAFTVEGIAVNKPDYADLNLKLAGKEGDVSLVADLLPDPYHSYFQDFQSSGAYTFSAFIRGRASKTQTPTVGVEVALRNGSVRSEKLQSPLENVSFRAVYSAPPNGKSVFEIAEFRGDFGGQPLAFNLRVSDLDDPSVDFQFSGSLPLNATYGLLDNAAVTGGDGLVQISNLSVQGRYADMTSMGRIPNVQAAGEIRFENASVIYNNVPVAFQSGSLTLNGNTLALDGLSARIGNSDFLLTANARNLLPVLFADSLNTADALLEFSGNLHAGLFDATEFLSIFAVQEADASGDQPVLDSLRTAANINRQRLMERLLGTFEANFDNIEYENLRGRNFSGQLAFDHNELALKGNVQAMQGRVSLDGKAYFALTPTMQLRIIAEDVDLKTCMEQCNNFGQEVVTDQNLRGRLSGRIVAYAFWDEHNTFLRDKLRAYADVQVTNGELIGLKMLESFSSFAHIEDLQRVKFTKLQNGIEISRGKMYLPAMFIQSNALNMTLSGTHSFDNNIDYKIKVNAGQLLVNKIKRHDPDLEPLPANNGLFNVFYTIVGTVDKYEMKRGKKAVKAEFERSEARKKTITAAIDEAFGGSSALPTAQEPDDDTEYLEPITGGQGGG
ncbi:MAG: AsmA-like C-terminal region-containing protein, partial [Saprospiraceae bacterium]